MYKLRLVFVSIFSVSPPTGAILGLVGSAWTYAHNSADGLESNALEVTVRKAMQVNTSESAEVTHADVSRLQDVPPTALTGLLAKFGLCLETVAPGEEIPGSYWGEAEAGLIGQRLLARADTPVHSVLHEACHYICMDSARRGGLNTDAGGDYDEENAVCYLQILLADHVSGLGRRRMFSDMDRWGYTFRLGSARAWFEHDAGDALDWLTAHGLVDRQQQPNWRVRTD